MIIKNKAAFDSEEFLKLYSWLRGNNSLFEDYPDIIESPQPTIINDENNPNNTDDSEDISIEEKFDLRYYFPNNGDPDTVKGTFRDKTAFASALFKDAKPTLIFTEVMSLLQIR